MSDTTTATSTPRLVITRHRYTGSGGPRSRETYRVSLAPEGVAIDLRTTWGRELAAQGLGGSHIVKGASEADRAVYRLRLHARAVAGAEVDSVVWTRS